MTPHRLSPFEAFGLLLIFAVAYVFTFNPGHILQSQALAFTHQLVKPNTPDTSFNLFKSPTISADFIERTLCASQSPACHTGAGQAMYSLGSQYGIDPAYALAFAMNETSYGKSDLARQATELYNIRCTPGYSCVAGFRSYATWSASIADWYKLIAWYRSDLHKTTLHDVVYTYAPPDDHNDTEGYIRTVAQSVTTWRGEQ